MSDAVKAIFDEMEGQFKKGALEKELTFYFSLGGDDLKWTVTVGPERCKVEQGKTVDAADCVLKTSAQFFERMVHEGYVPGVMDFTRGKVKSNDPLLLKDLKAAFDW